MNADAAFEEFSRSISICIFNRMLGVVSLVLIIVSSMCLLLCYWLLTGSRYVEQFMVNICADIDIVYFKSLANDIIQIVSDSANELVGRNFVSKTKIKSEFSSMLERHLAPDWATTLTDDEASCSDSVTDVSEVEIKEETIDVTDDNNDDDTSHSSDENENENDSEVVVDNSNDDDTAHTSNENDGENENDSEVVVDNSNDVIDNFIDNILNNVAVNPVSTNTETDSIDSEIDDITEQCLAEKRENRTIIDLQSDNED
jgi:cobalamin biosynthesis protein CobT